MSIDINNLTAVTSENNDDDATDSGPNYRVSDGAEAYRLAVSGAKLFGAAVGESEYSSAAPGPDSNYFPNRAIGQMDSDPEPNLGRAMSPIHYFYNQHFNKGAKKAAQKAARADFGKAFNLMEYRKVVKPGDVYGDDPEWVRVHDSPDGPMYDFYLPIEWADLIHEFAAEHLADNWDYAPTAESITEDSDDFGGFEAAAPEPAPESKQKPITMVPAEDSEADSDGNFRDGKKGKPGRGPDVFTDYAGVGPVTAQRMKEAGFSPQHAMFYSTAALTAIDGISEKTAAKIQGYSA